MRMLNWISQHHFYTIKAEPPYIVPFACIENLPATNANVLNVCCIVICVIGEILKWVYWDMVIEQNKIAIIPKMIEKKNEIW